jgi:molybdopterin molybdotransferase
VTRKFLPVVPADEVRRLIGDLAPLGTEKVSLESCVGRSLSGNVAAADDLPPFRRSTVDGYAVRGLETTGASSSSPAYLKLAGEVLVGREALDDPPPGSCVRIPTGGMVPPSADAVVMVEYTRELPGCLVEVSGSVAPGENVVQRGEDAEKGRPVLARGTILRPADVGILAGLGVTAVPVFRRVRVAILSTGDELVEPRATPGPGQVRNVNQYSLHAHVTACGAEPHLLGLSPDDAVEIEGRMRQGLGLADMLIVSGGSSVGVRDMTADIIGKLGKPGVLVHGVAVRPGKPTIVGRVGEKWVFGLPGHPVSAMVAFANFVAPALRALAGVAGDDDPPVPARLVDNVHSKPGREDYVQVSLRHGSEGLEAVPIFKKSGMVTTLTESDGWIVIPAASEGLEGGEMVLVRRYPRVLR